MYGGLVNCLTGEIKGIYHDPARKEGGREFPENWSYKVKVPSFEGGASLYIKSTQENKEIQVGQVWRFDITDISAYSGKNGNAGINIRGIAVEGYEARFELAPISPRG